jgi:hypothetical protein
MKRSDRSWIKLLTFFAVTVLGSSLVFAAVIAGVTAAVGDGSPQASEQRQAQPEVSSQTFSGVITDMHCGPRHTNSKEDASDCARKCVRDGSSYIIVDGDRSYQLDGDLLQLSELAGQRVTLTGVLNRNTIQVSSASAVAR